MNRLIMLAVACLALAGCVVVPAHGYYYRHAVVVAPAPVVVAPAPVVAFRPW